jgi:RNA polymerase sigma factor (sigma-70 family)
MEQAELADRFEAERPRLRAVALRMLGSSAEADDAVQETWLRLDRTGAADQIENLAAWLTTVVSRICLDLLRSRSTRREDPLHERPEAADGPDPAEEAELTDAVGAALLVVLDTLRPAERLAFVLHDLFALPFDDIAAITGRSPAAVRQLASRGRRRVQAPEELPERARRTQRRVVEAFLTASRSGDLAGLVELLDPGAVVRADGVAVAMGSAPVVEGASAAAETFSGRALGARLVEIDGYAGATWSRHGELTVAFSFTMEDDRIVEIELLADPDVLAVLDWSPLED